MGLAFGRKVTLAEAGSSSYQKELVSQCQKLKTQNIKVNYKCRRECLEKGHTSWLTKGIGRGTLPEHVSKAKQPYKVLVKVKMMFRCSEKERFSNLARRTESSREQIAIRNCSNSQ